jgi:transcriptional regulator with XRE-family HTH domain
MDKRALIAKRVRMARAGADLTLKEIAQKVSAELGYEVSYEIIRRIEHGQRPADAEVLDAIAKVTGESPWFLYGMPFALDIPGSPQADDDYSRLPVANLNSDWAHELAWRILVGPPPVEQPELPISFGPRQSSWFSMARERLESAAA